MVTWIKKILGYCECCKTYFVYPKRRRRNTNYENDKMNFVTLCLNCFEEQEQMWDELWADYYASRF